MNSQHLHEHDANQGAQSSGEFLGMTGNSGWCLLGSAGVTIMLVIFLWGIFGVSLLLCLFVGILLCLSSVAYVFALKNNKPAHYDSDFFEAALVEAGVVPFCFGPRASRLANPFICAGGEPVAVASSARRRSVGHASSSSRRRVGTAPVPAPLQESGSGTQTTKGTREKVEPMVARAVHERLQEKLATTEELLEDALAESSED